MSENSAPGGPRAYQPADGPRGPRYFTNPNPTQNQPVPNAFQSQPQGRAPAFQQPRPVQPARTQKPPRKGFPVFGILALAVLTAMLMIFAVTVVISMQRYTPIRGISNSPYVGINNYERVLSMPTTPPAMGTTLAMRLFEGLLSLLVAAAFCALYYAVKKPGAALLLGCLWLIPVCVPPVSMAMLVTKTLGLRPVSHEAGIAGYALSTFLQTAGLFCFSGGLFTALNLMKKGKAGKGPYFGLLIGALVWLLAGMTTNLDADLSTSTAMSGAGSLDRLIYAQSFMNANFGVSGAMSVIKVLLQIALAIVPLVVLCILARKKSTKGKTPLMVLWVFLAFLTVFGASIAVGFLGGITGASPIVTGLLNSLMVSLMGGCLGGLIAYSFVHLMRRSPSLLFGLIAVLLCAAMSCKAAQYLLMQQMSIVNTLYPAVLLAAFDPRLILLSSLLAFALRDHMERRPGSLVLAMALLCAAFAWGNMTLPMLYTNSRALYTLPYYLRQVTLNTVSSSAADTSQSMVQAYGERMKTEQILRLLTALPPMLLGVGGALLMKRAFNPFNQMAKG